MSAIAAPASRRAPHRLRARAAALYAHSDVRAAAILTGLLMLLVAITWRKWGNPEIDSGAELTTGGLLAQGDVPYDDVRYYYGPLGLYGLAGAFKVFGTSFTVVFAFGIVQTAAIVGVFYALCRHWLRPLAATLSAAVLLAIAFSGTEFDFVLPHTNSATLGLLFVLVELLALTRHRRVVAGVALGLVCLTRPEFVAVAVAAAVAYALGLARDQDRREAFRASAAIALPGLAIPAVVLGAFAAVAGASRLFTDNLWPVDFIRVSGFESQKSWIPLTFESFVGLAARGLLYGGLLAALVAATLGWRRATGAARVVALWPLAAAGAALLVVDVIARGLGLFEGERAAIEEECTRLLIGMSWLPALALAVGAWGLVRFVRRRPAPLSDSWAVDLALLAAAAALGARAYAEFTPEDSYAAYYAAPLVLLLGLLHQRVADRWPGARTMVYGALGAVAVGLAAYALVGLYPDKGTAVHTARGTYLANTAAAPAIQGAVDWLRSSTAPGERVLTATADGGLHFMADRRPALYEITLLPGLLDTRADERAAIRRLEAERVGAAAISARDLSDFGARTFGRDYNQLLGAWLRDSEVERRVVGTLRDPAAGTYPSRGYTLLTLEP